MRSLLECIAQTARDVPDKTALVVGDESLSFRQLDRFSSQLASALCEKGIEPGDTITLYSANGWEWAVSYYAVQKAGAVVNPVNVMLTAEEVEFIVNDCNSAAVLGSGQKLHQLADLKSKSAVREMVCFDENLEFAPSLQSVMEGRSERFEPRPVEPDDVATICYTSGTTGHPKGAMQTAQNVLMNAQMTSLMHGRHQADIVVTALPCPHVYGTVVLNSAMINGMTLVLHPTFDERAVLESINRHRATMFEGVPTMYYYLLNNDALEDYDLSSLRICTVGGQTMPPTKMQEVESRFGCPLVELWGMTELAGLGTTFAHTGPLKHGSIGVPLPYCQARIADVADPSRSLPPDNPGELMIRGPIVMAGYYGNEAQTTEMIESDGWLHTGDVAYMDDEGFIFIVDRIKDMILTAGFNVYPAEIERVVAEHPDVAMVAVGPIPDEAKGELAKAYVVPKKDATCDAESIVAHCRGHLAAYKVPRAVQFVSDLPKTSTGKILRRKLHELD